MELSRALFEATAHKNRIKENKVLVAQSCPTLCNPMDCSRPGSSVHRNLQARLLKWVARKEKYKNKQEEEF